LDNFWIAAAINRLAMTIGEGLPRCARNDEMGKARNDVFFFVITRRTNVRRGDLWIAAATSRLAMTIGERLAMTFSFSSSRGGRMSDVVIYGLPRILLRRARDGNKKAEGAVKKSRHCEL